ncbi:MULTISPECIES: DUF3370 domain-containing protein [unclassified Leptolyngbya]|uniref:DUF3370 domain-containing protein n=1 Tax=unclassified Leptolyngbya TaxID=2650499 RepID=UPI001688841D|nr:MULTISPECIES: DUF3370 domain-containing protein [unclassified Leptolyngbya]MBD1912970.1 DUF3370 domain-containing protein [Leptolyngbya sp. FACHB-8]MBD2155719.1 DUF3370 domain-containing protein [Leptolyngbya sp. FACHB-16]
MLTLLSFLLPVSIPTPPPLLAQSTPHQYVYEPQEVRPLPGQLDEVPVFNSNSPEVVQQEGILLSTFPPDGMRVPSAHLDYAFEGRFDLFIHHIAKGQTPEDVRTLFLGVLVHNPSDETVTVEVSQAVSYLSQEAPFYDLPSYVADTTGRAFAGPGSRTTTDILRGVDQGFLPDRFRLPPGSTQLLFSAPIPLRSLQEFQQGMPLPLFVDPATEAGLDAAEATSDNPLAPTRPVRPRGRDIPINGRTALVYLDSNGPINVASLGMFSRVLPDGREIPPSTEDWIRLLQQGDLAGPRDVPPTPPNQRTSSRRFYYGRVAGVAQGSLWSTRLTDDSDSEHLSIPEAGQSISYAISTVDRNTLGTGQIQSAPILARYPDTAYRAHGNYGIHYQIEMPLRNNTDRTQQVAVLFQTPLKDETLQGRGLRFMRPPLDRVFYRGTLRIRYTNDWGAEQTRYVHVVQRRGQEGEPLVTLSLRPGEERDVEVEFLYPPDATPPQALTIETLAPTIIPRPNPDEGYPTLSNQPGTPTSLEPHPTGNRPRQ